MVQYRRLTRDERYQIQALLRSGLGIRKIANQLERVPSTISRELRKAGSLYHALQAEELTQRIRKRPYPDLRRIQGKLEAYVRKKILQDWSPEEICGCLRLQGKSTVSHQTIYRYLRQDKAAGGVLTKHLRILRKQRKDNKPRYKPTRLVGRTMIEKRPAIVAKRKRLGDYERDTVLGKVNRPLLLTIVDRTSRKAKISKIARKCSHLVHSATVRRLRNEPLHTVTNDNGTEFSRHRETAKALKTKIYFSNSYRSWERGSNENFNGLLRQYFPRKKDIGNVPHRELRKIENLLNNRPRKCLGFRTPNQVHAALKALVLR